MSEAEQIKALLKRIEALEERIKELEARTVMHAPITLMKFGGEWLPQSSPAVGRPFCAGTS